MEAHVALAIEEQWYEWDFPVAERNFKRAIELDPGDADARGYYSWFLPPMLRAEEGMEQARLLSNMYPLSTGANGNLGSVMVFAHQWDQAIKQLKYAIHLDPNYWFDYCFLARALEQQNRYVEAIDTFKSGLKLDGNVELWSGLGHAYAASGNKVEAQKVLDHMQELSTQRYIGPYNFAVIYANLGDKDRAFELLDHAHDARSYLLVQYLNTDPRLKHPPRRPALQCTQKTCRSAITANGLIPASGLPRKSGRRFQRVSDRLCAFRPQRWMIAARVSTRRIFRAVSRTPWGKGISENVTWYVVRRCAERMQMDHLAPHDLRRTCAKLCYVNGGEIDQIQFLLGHASVLTTERYLGCKQNLEEPVNDRFGCLFALRTVQLR